MSVSNVRKEGEAVEDVAKEKTFFVRLGSVEVEVLSEATRGLYHLDLDDFKKLVLAPQMREDFLRKELALRAKDPEAWLKNAFQNARVKIYFLDYKWREGRLTSM